MIQWVTGNLVEDEVEALVNTVNTVGVMGKGIALQFRQAFPENYDAYRKACERGEVQLGRMFVTATNRIRPLWIVNFPTKRHWKSKSRLADIEAGLVDLEREIAEHRIASIAVPPLGCGHGGLRWQDVRPLIEDALGSLPDLLVRVYAPGATPAPQQMPVRTRRPAMTPGRAALVGMLDRYIEPGLGATPLEIQKLMYFLQEAGQSLKLQYARARYGPYAENLNHVLQRVEGHFLRGYGDRTQRVLDAEPLELDRGAVDEARDVLDADPDLQSRMASVLELVEGFESPYGLELLASLHWIAKEEDAAREDPDVALKLLWDWTPRKGRLFREDHLRTAWSRLRDTGWLATASR